MKYGARNPSEKTFDTSKEWRTMARFLVRLGLVAMTLVCVSKDVHSQQSAASQTTAVTKTIDPAKYQTIDECVALRDRLRDSVNRMRIDRDTLPWTIAEQREPLQPVMVEAVARCGVKFQANATAIKDWALASLIFLTVGRDNEAVALLGRRLSAITSEEKSAQRERASVLDTTIRILLTDAQPPRFHLADSLMTVLASLPDEADVWSERIKRSSLFFNIARVYEEDVYAKKYAQMVYDMGSKITDAERRTATFTDTIRGMIFFSLEHLDKNNSFDSLRHGSLAGYFALKRKNFVLATKEAAESFPFPWGNQAPVLQGRWFNGEGTLIEHATPRPTKGKVSLLVFYGMEYCWSGNRCLGSYAVLRRLKQRFPDLEINLIADHPPAWFGPRTKTDPKDEGAMWGKWLLGFHHIPGEVVLESPGYWRIAGLDRRAIMNPVENPRAYRGKLPLQGRSMATMEGYLVDQTGYIVDWIPQGLNREYEPTLTTIIEILLQRSVTSTNTTGKS